jgi:hypothetical protein
VCRRNGSQDDLPTEEGRAVQSSERRRLDHVGPSLKTPHATSPNKLARLWFHPRSIYLSTGLTVTQAKESRSICSDFKNLPVALLLTWGKNFAEAEEATTAEPMDEDEGQARHLRTQEAK